MRPRHPRRLPSSQQYIPAHGPVDGTTLLLLALPEWLFGHYIHYIHTLYMYIHYMHTLYMYCLSTHSLVAPPFTPLLPSAPCARFRTLRDLLGADAFIAPSRLRLMRSLGAGAFARVQQAELWPPGVEAPASPRVGRRSRDLTGRQALPAAAGGAAQAERAGSAALPEIVAVKLLRRELLEDPEQARAGLGGWHCWCCAAAGSARSPPHCHHTAAWAAGSSRATLQAGSGARAALTPGTHQRKSKNQQPHWQTQATACTS